MVEKHAVIDETQALLAVTPGGKEIVLTRRHNCSVRMIMFRGGGELPKVLQGGYSSIHDAETAALSYVASLKKKATKKK